MVEAAARVSQAHPSARRWRGPLLAFTGGVLFLYGASLPLVESARVCCPRLIVFLVFDSRVLTELLSICVPVLAFAAALRLVIAPAARPGLARGLLLLAGLVGISLILGEAGALIHIKGGLPAAGALLGFSGAALILASSVLEHRKGVFEEKARHLGLSLPFLGPAVILLGAGLFIVALLMPWTSVWRPEDTRLPLRLVSGTVNSPYWFWSIVLPSAIILPVIFAAYRMLSGLRRPQTEVGMALGGGIFATLLFVQLVGRAVSSPAGPPGLPPIYLLEPWVYLGMAAGGLIVAGAVVHGFFLRR